MKTIVIGSGVSGLTAGAALARAGHEVEVFEQYHRPGGVTGSFERDGYKWDLGQLLVEGFGPDEPTGRVLDQLGVLDQIQVRVEDRGYVFPDFDLRKPGPYGGPRWRMDRLKTLFPEEAPGLDLYWRDYLRFTRVMTAARRVEAARGSTGLYWKAKLFGSLLPLLPKKDWSAQRLMDHYFRSDRLKLVFTSILADFFTPPSKFIGLGVFALNAEASFDHRVPRLLARDAEQLYHYSVLGGMDTLVAALIGAIEARGGKIFTNRPVARILVSDNRVVGVLDGEGNRSEAGAVIASGGARETFFDLVGAEHLPPDFADKVENIPLMDSVFMLHLGVDFDPSPALGGVCTYSYGTYDIEGEITRAKAGFYHEGRAGFVIHVPSLHSPQMAPAGHHALTIYTICPDRLQEGSWDERKEVYAAALIACAEQLIPGLSDHVRVCEVITPDDFRRRTRLDHHAFGGLAPWMGAWKPPHHTPVQGLWFVGAQSESGGGVNNVIPAAYKTAQRAIQTF